MSSEPPAARPPRFHRNGGIVFQHHASEVWLWADRTLWSRRNATAPWEPVQFDVPTTILDVLLASIEAGIHALALADDQAPFREAK
jgi:hypothetical protein